MVSPKAVAVVFGSFPPDRDGGADFMALFAPAVAELGVQVHVVTSAGDRTERVVFDGGVVVHRIVADWTVTGGRHDLRDVNRLLEREGVEVVHVFFPHSELEGRYQLPAAIGLRRAPLVTTFWNLGLGLRSPLPVRLEALALIARSTLLSAHDPLYLEAIQRIVQGRKPVHMLPVGSNIPTETRRARGAVRRELGLAGVPVLAYFGQLDFTRGVEDLFDALATLRRGEIDARLVMLGGAGSVRSDRYRALADCLGIGEAVVWPAYLEPAEAADVLAATDVCVLPYRRRSFGRSAVAAALSLGVPTVLAGTADGVSPLVPGYHVELVPPASPDALAATVRNLLGDPARRERLAAGARDAAQLFAWPRIAEAALGLYRLALSRRRFRRASSAGDPGAA